MKSNGLKDMLGRVRLTPVDEAQSLLLRKLSPLIPSTISCTLTEALNRVTAHDILSPEDLPPHPRSTMDGFAIRAEDSFGATSTMPAYLTIDGEVKMGEMPTGRVEKTKCYRIATGGIVPEGSDAVMMFEHTIPVDERMIEVVKSIGVGANVINRGEDIQKGGLALPAGHQLRPQDLGLLAGLGIQEIEVFTEPKVGILSTGDEIVPYAESPPAGKIRDINGITLAAACKSQGAVVTDYGIVSDEEESFLGTVRKATEENDIVLFSGGSSVGMRDLGERVIEKLGSPGILVHGVALKPGKPVLIGLCDQAAVFGLPGHPVSAMVCFELFVKLAIKHFAGLVHPHSGRQATVRARLDRNLNSAAGRLDLIRVQLQENAGELPIATPVLGRSGAISTLSRAHGYFFIDETSQGFNKDTEVEVHLLT